MAVGLSLNYSSSKNSGNPPCTEISQTDIIVNGSTFKKIDSFCNNSNEKNSVHTEEAVNSIPNYRATRALNKNFRISRFSYYVSKACAVYNVLR